jgi:acyl carrier protein
MTDTDKVLDQLRDIFVQRLRFDAAQRDTLTAATALPKGVDGSLGLDSLDFLEVALGIEERFGFVIDESGDVAPHFQSLGTLAAWIVTRVDGG